MSADARRPWEVCGTVEYTPEMLAALESLAPYMIRRSIEQDELMALAVKQPMKIITDVS